EVRHERRRRRLRGCDAHRAGHERGDEPRTNQRGRKMKRGDARAHKQYLEGPAASDRSGVGEATTLLKPAAILLDAGAPAKAEAGTRSRLARDVWRDRGHLKPRRWRTSTAPIGRPCGSFDRRPMPRISSRKPI